jgi:hypothetical protein
MMGKGATSIAQIPRLAVVAEEPSSLFLLRTAIAETEVAAEGDTVPQSSVVTARSRKQVSLPSLPLPPSNPAAADDQDEQIRKKVKFIVMEFIINSFRKFYNTIGQVSGCR